MSLQLLGHHPLSACRTGLVPAFSGTPWGGAGPSGQCCRGLLAGLWGCIPRRTVSGVPHNQETAQPPREGKAPAPGRAVSLCIPTLCPAPTRQFLIRYLGARDIPGTKRTPARQALFFARVSSLIPCVLCDFFPRGRPQAGQRAPPPSFHKWGPRPREGGTAGSLDPEHPGEQKEGASEGTAKAATPGRAGAGLTQKQSGPPGSQLCTAPPTTWIPVCGIHWHVGS